MEMNDFDVIVIGGGINSMIAASLLGQAGRKVTILEAREETGGMASTVEFTKGFQCNLKNDYIRWIDPRLYRKLNLKVHGLVLNSPDIMRVALEDNDRHIFFHRNPKQTAESIKRHSGMDAEKWPVFSNYIGKCTRFL